MYFELSFICNHIFTYITLEVFHMCLYFIFIINFKSNNLIFFRIFTLAFKRSFICLRIYE